MHDCPPSPPSKSGRLPLPPLPPALAPLPSFSSPPLQPNPSWTTHFHSRPTSVASSSSSSSHLSPRDSAFSFAPTGYGYKEDRQGSPRPMEDVLAARRSRPRLSQLSQSDDLARDRRTRSSTSSPVPSSPLPTPPPSAYYTPPATPLLSSSPSHCSSPGERPLPLTPTQRASLTTSHNVVPVSPAFDPQRPPRSALPPLPGMLPPLPDRIPSPASPCPSIRDSTLRFTPLVNPFLEKDDDDDSPFDPKSPPTHALPALPSLRSLPPLPPLPSSETVSPVPHPSDWYISNDADPGTPESAPRNSTSAASVTVATRVRFGGKSRGSGSENEGVGLGLGLTGYASEVEFENLLSNPLPKRRMAIGRKISRPGMGQRGKSAMAGLRGDRSEGDGSGLESDEGGNGSASDTTSQESEIDVDASLETLAWRAGVMSRQLIKGDKAVDGEDEEVLRSPGKRGTLLISLKGAKDASRPSFTPARSLFPTTEDSDAASSEEEESFDLSFDSTISSPLAATLTPFSSRSRESTASSIGSTATTRARTRTTSEKEVLASPLAKHRSNGKESDAENVELRRPRFDGRQRTLSSSLVIPLPPTPAFRPLSTGSPSPSRSSSSTSPRASPQGSPSRLAGRFQTGTNGETTTTTTTTRSRAIPNPVTFAPPTRTRTSSSSLVSPATSPTLPPRSTSSMSRLTQPTRPSPAFAPRTSSPAPPALSAGTSASPLRSIRGSSAMKREMRNTTTEIVWLTGGARL